MKKDIKKTIARLFLFLIGTAAISSCSDYLDSGEYFKDRMNIDLVFSSKAYSEEWLAHTYSDLTNECADVASKGYTPHCFADDMYYGDRDGDYDIKDISALSYNEFHTGSFDENTKQDTWTQCYQGIRNATTFIQNIDLNKEMTETEIADYKAQARFVRAYFYWLLLRKYGPIPLLPEEGIDYTKSYEDIALARSSYEECADYIAGELALAATVCRLPALPKGLHWLHGQKYCYTLPAHLPTGIPMPMPWNWWIKKAVNFYRPLTTKKNGPKRPRPPKM